MPQTTSPTAQQRLGLVVVTVVVAAAILTAQSGDLPTTADEVAREVQAVEGDAFAYSDSRAEEFVERASRGLAHPIYELSPDGVEATAERVDGYREEVEAAAEGAGVEPDALEAVIFLESAGRADAVAGPTPESAAGLGQILPGTAEDFLDMSVDLEQSIALSAQIAELQGRLDSGGPDADADAERTEQQLAKLEATRAEVDERFEPEAALAGAARYLAIGEGTFGREDLAIASYHMGIGNLENVIATYVAPDEPAETTAETVAEHDLSYAQLYFDSTPLHNPLTHTTLRDLGDDSRHYLFRTESAREIMDLYRDDPEELRRRARLHAGEDSSEDILRPPDETEQFAGPEQLEEAYDDGDLIRLERDPDRFGYELAPELGELADELGVDRSLYGGLRPEALATLIYAAERVREIAGRQATLPVVGAVYDVAYRGRLDAADPGTEEDSPNTTGYAFDIDSDGLTEDETQALDAVLTRLTALEVVAASEARGTYRVTVGPRGEELLGG